MKNKILWLSVLSGTLLLMAGCFNLGGGTRETTRFYILDAVCDPIQIASSGTPLPAIGIEPIKLPDILNRQQMVTRISENEVRIEPFARWASPLSQNIGSVLSENLSRLLGPNAIVPFPWTGAVQPTYRVRVMVLSFIGGLGQEASLEVRWTLTDTRHQQLIINQRSRFASPVPAAGFTELVATQSNLLASLSREIADTVCGLPVPPAAGN